MVATRHCLSMGSEQLNKFATMLGVGLLHLQTNGEHLGISFGYVSSSGKECFSYFALGAWEWLGFDLHYPAQRTSTSAVSALHADDRNGFLGRLLLPTSHSRYICGIPSCVEHVPTSDWSLTSAPDFSRGKHRIRAWWTSAFQSCSAICFD